MESPSLIPKALQVAYDAHKQQFRKGSDGKSPSIPYISHLFAVAKNLMESGASETVVVAGLLHDTLEDTDYSAIELERVFGSEVLRIVQACSEPGNTADATDAEQRASWKRRKQHTIDGLKDLRKDEILVALADKTANLQSTHDELDEIDWSKFNASKEDIEWYNRSLEKEFSRLCKNKLSKVFSKLVDEVFGEKKGLIE